MCVRLRVCARVCIRVCGPDHDCWVRLRCPFVGTLTCSRVCRSMGVRQHIGVRACVCMLVCVCVRESMHACMCVCVCVCAYASACTLTRRACTCMRMSLFVLINSDCLIDRWMYFSIRYKSRPSQCPKH